MNDAPNRPDPEALLRIALQEGRGRLKVFLGAAPGVGKTYEMLSEGAALRRDGKDVVIGVVETHGRIETEALVRGQDIVARQEIAYQGRTLAEMDLDAILERRPSLVLVDELAHTNAPGSRHPKRFQDVEELLDAGIDVFTTVNIQHIESLNDVVASFTRVRVRETVPDRILEQAEIEVVDIPADELIQRLKEGKVYVPDEATRALGHFFSKSNLSALRELALRRAAQAVDAQMLDYVRSHALAGPLAGSERIVVAVSELAGADGLVRSAKRIADAFHAPWTTVTVETPRSRTLGEPERRRLTATLDLAGQLGATIVTLPAMSVIEGLRAHLRDSRATQLVVGKSVRSRWFELRHGSVVDRLVRETSSVAVHVLPMDDAPQPKFGKAPGRATWGKQSDYLSALLMVAGVTGGALSLFRILNLNLANVALLYLLPVMVAASLFGLRAGLFAGVVSSLAYNFFFLPPTGTLTINNPENVVTIVVLLGVAFVTSQFAARVRSQADIAAASARSNAALADFLRRITASANEGEVGQAICVEIARLFGVQAVLMGIGDDGAQVRAAFPPDDRLDAIDLAAAQWVLDRGQLAGRGSDTLAASEWLFHPIRSGNRVHAALGVSRANGAAPLALDQLPLLMTLLDQAALGLERVRLEEEMRDVAQLKERDRLRTALLSSVSHDLRTPLTTIVIAAEALPADAAPNLVASIRIETERLNRFVGNLLDMARVESGALVLRVESVDLTDAVAAAVHDVRRSLEGHAIELAVAPDLPLVRVDPHLFHHCLINLLDNAGRYADVLTPIAIRAIRTPDRLSLSMIDRGPGLPEGHENEVFETFRRFQGSDQAKSGTGLGLAIVKGFTEAMGLTVEASSIAEPKGACFTIHFPDDLLVRVDEEMP